MITVLKRLTYASLVLMLCVVVASFISTASADGFLGFYIGLPVFVDIKPGVWPNPINIASDEVFAVAICGTESFDVTTIDPVTVRLSDITTPIDWSYKDVATPYEGPPGGGHAYGGDGYLDLVLDFDTPEVVHTLGLDEHVGETIPLTIRGSLYLVYDGTPIMGQDYVQILGPGIPQFSLPLVVVTSLAAVIYLALRKRIGKKLK